MAFLVDPQRTPVHPPSGDPGGDVRHARMMRHPVIRLVVLATALACLLLAGLSAWFIWSARQAQIRQTEVATSNVARLVGAQVEAAIKTAAMALTDVTERVQQDGTRDLALERLRRHLVDLARTTPELHGLFVYDADGAWLATSLDRPFQGNNADRAYFQYHRRHAGSAVHVGAPVKSRSTGVWIIPVSRRIDGPGNTFAGVALVTLRINFFERIYDELDIGEHGTVLLMLADGTVVYRRPFDDKLIGTDLSNGKIFNELRRRDVGSAFLLAKVDRVERLYSFRRLAEAPFLVAVGRTKDELLSHWQQSSVVIAVAALAICAVFVLFAGKLVTQLRMRDAMDRRLRLYSAQLQEHNHGLRMLADTDKLTGLANRRRFDDVLELELKRAQRSGAPLSLLLMDLDHFKQFNDSYGHPAGDACLASTGAVLAARIVRAGDLAARYGGEEFAVILPNTGRGGAVAVAEGIRTDILARRIPHRHSPAQVVSASIGVATLRSGAGARTTTADELIACADRQLYDAKARGRNRVCTAELGNPAST